MKTNTYSEILKSEKQFCYMLCANIISRFGDSIDAIAYSWMVYTITGSKSWLAVILGVNMIPTVLFQPFSGALTEFFDKKRIMVMCDFLRGFLVFVTGMLMITGVVRPWHLLVLTFLNSTFEALRIPYGLAVLPQVLRKENYKGAISLNQSAGRAAELVGLGSAGVFIGVIGIGGALFVDAITFFASGILLALMKIRAPKGEKQELQAKQYFRSLREGILYFRKSDIAVMVCVICVVLNLVTLPAENLKAAYISEFLHLDVMAMSIGSTALTIGMILGSLLLPALSKKISDRRLLLGGGFLIGLFYFVFIFVGSIPCVSGKYIGYFVTAFLFGFLNSLIGVAVQVIFVTRVPDELLGRIGSIFNALACSSMPIGSFALAVIASALSIAEIYALTAVLSILAFVFIAHLRGVKKLEILESG